MRSISLALILFLAIPVSAQVDSGTFSIRVAAGSDSIPPSVPVFISVTPAASTQIDLVWGASTDNFFLQGYSLFRDGVPIATTTQTSFSDVGLTASTTYSYTLQAFDSSYNYSSTSATSTATTPPPPVVTSAATSSGSQSTRVRPILDNFAITTTETSAALAIETRLPARMEVRWGRSASYEIGFTVLERYITSYEQKITDLEPGTTYEYEVIAYAPNGMSSVLKRGQFTTLSETAAAPANVRNLGANITGSTVDLRWELPVGDIAQIRIVRSYLGYPVNPNDGAIVYQSLGTSFTDSAVLDSFSPAYYTVFAYDSKGNVSSGSVVSAASLVAGGGIVVPIDATNETPVRSEEGAEVFNETATTSDEVSDGESVRIPAQQEVRIISGGDTFTFADAQVRLSSAEPFMLQVPVTAVSKNLKTLLLRFTNPENQKQSYSYILRLSKDGTAYEAIIDSTRAIGWSEFTFVLYDYDAKIVARYKKRVAFEQEGGEGMSVWFPDYIYDRLFEIGLGTGALLVLLMLLAFAVRRSEDK